MFECDALTTGGGAVLTRSNSFWCITAIAAVVVPVGRVVDACAGAGGAAEAVDLPA